MTLYGLIVKSECIREYLRAISRPTRYRKTSFHNQNIKKCLKIITFYTVIVWLSDLRRIVISVSLPFLFFSSFSLTLFEQIMAGYWQYCTWNKKQSVFIYLNTLVCYVHCQWIYLYWCSTCITWVSLHGWPRTNDQIVLSCFHTRT